MYQSSNFKYKMASIVNTIHQGPKEIIMIRPGAEGVETKLHKGASINHVDSFLEIFDPPPPSWTILLNKAYVVTWTFG